METELDQMIDLAAHLYSASQIVVAQVARMEQREQARLKKAAQRHHAATQTDSGPTLERRTA